MGFFSDVFKTITSPVTDLVNSVAGGTAKVVHEVAAPITTGEKQLAGVAKTGEQVYGKTVSSLGNSAEGAVSNVAGSARGAITGLGDDVKGIAAPLTKGLGSGLSYLPLVAGGLGAAFLYTQMKTGSDPFQRMMELRMMSQAGTGPNKRPRVSTVL